MSEIMSALSAIGEVWMINLDRRADRWAAAREALGGAPNRYPAVDGSQLETSKWGMLPGEQACGWSHWDLLSRIAGSDKPYVIMEDDVLPMDGCAENIRSSWNAFGREKWDWDLFYLAANHVSPAVQLGVGIARCVKAYSTCAYVVNPLSIGWLLDGFDWNRCQIDVWLHRRNRGRHYCLAANAFTQRPDFSDVQGGWVDYREAF